MRCALSAFRCQWPARRHTEPDRATNRRCWMPDRAAQLTLDERLRSVCARRPDDLAVIEARDAGDATLTWRQLLDRVERTATLFLRLGVRPGECVAYQLPNCLEFVVMTLAVLRIGAICCPLMPIFREREVAFCLRRSGARVLFVPDEARGRHHAEEIAALLAEASIFNGELPLRLEHVLVSSGERKTHALPAADNDNGTVNWLRLQDALRRDRGRRRRARRASHRSKGARAAALHIGDVGRTQGRAASQRRSDARGRDGGRASRPRTRTTASSSPRRSHIRPVSSTACGWRS